MDNINLKKTVISSEVFNSQPIKIHFIKAQDWNIHPKFGQA